jgi:hypothetical protein
MSSLSQDLVDLLFLQPLDKSYVAAFGHDNKGEYKY